MFRQHLNLEYVAEPAEVQISAPMHTRREYGNRRNTQRNGTNFGTISSRAKFLQRASWIGLTEWELERKKTDIPLIIWFPKSILLY